MALQRVGLARYRPVTLLVVPDVVRLDAATGRQFDRAALVRLLSSLGGWGG